MVCVVMVIITVIFICVYLKLRKQAHRNRLPPIPRTSQTNGAVQPPPSIVSEDPYDYITNLNENRDGYQKMGSVVNLPSENNDGYLTPTPSGGSYKPQSHSSAGSDNLSRQHPQYKNVKPLDVYLLDDNYIHARNINSKGKY